MKYCSIDLEFTGFEPEKDQILEIGFVFFDVTEEGVVLGEKWQQVFQPDIEVHEKILGLTGITQEELDAAPKITDFVEFLSAKLSDKTLLAHNPTLDVKFLESVGVKLSGNVIDTLELVQFLLPTHHSYNLENLAHYFDIKHTGSHRALSDAVTTALLLNDLLNIFSSYSLELKQNLRNVMRRGIFSWQHLFEENYSFKNIKTFQDSLKNEIVESEEVDLSVDKQVIYDANNFQHEFRLANSLNNKSSKYVLAVSSDRQVLDLWKAGTAEGVFRSSDLFNKNLFDSFFYNAQTSEELRFVLKILVWQETNWQCKTILDLNLSFFGGQFKSFITGGEENYNSDSLCMSYQTLLGLSSSNDDFKFYRLIISNITQFEHYVTSKLEKRLSWLGLLFNLKKSFGEEESLSEEDAGLLANLLAQADLLFGLFHISLIKNITAQYAVYPLNDFYKDDSYEYLKLQNSVNNFLVKLDSLSNKLLPEILNKLKADLSEMFNFREGYLKWASLEKYNIFIYSQPLDIALTLKNLWFKFESTAYSTNILNFDSLLFINERLGLDTEIAVESKNLENNSISISSYDNLANYLTNNILSTAVIFDSAISVKDFYKKYYIQLKQFSHVLAQDYSGSGNKIFRNFSLFNSCILLATSDFIVKQKYQIDCDQLLMLNKDIQLVNNYYQSCVYKKYRNEFTDLDQILLNILMSKLTFRLSLRKNVKVLQNDIDF